MQIPKASWLWLSSIVYLCRGVNSFFFSKSKNNNDVEDSFENTMQKLNDQCEGLLVDFSRLQTISDELDNLLLEIQSNPDTEFQATINSEHSVRAARVQKPSSTMISTPLNYRLREMKNGIKINGAELVVTTRNTTFSEVQVQTVQGKRFSDLNIPFGTFPTHKISRARQTAAHLFGVPVDFVSTDLSLEIYPTSNGDYVVFLGDVLVGMTLYEFVIDATTLQLICKCQVPAYSRAQQETIRQPPPRHLRETDTVEPKENQSQLVCESCLLDRTDHNFDPIQWSEEVSSCPLQSIYLNNTQKNVPCNLGLDSKGQQVFGPGPVPSLFWDGVLDCRGGTDLDTCQLSPFPESCNDAISDIHFAATRTFEYLKNYLGLVGGYTQNNQSVYPVKAYAHYDKLFCNAFYRPSDNNLYFGNCDCNVSGALVSTEIVAHEIMHLVTRHSSKLAWTYESGALNEGYSDILGSVMEFIIDDDRDVPEFTMGEPIGRVVRNMESPSQFGGLESVCQFDINTLVHQASGPLNKAYVSSVRACETQGCTTSERDCAILMGSLFLWSNIHHLTMYSGYLDAAEASCDSVDDFLLVQQLEGDILSCTSEDIKSLLTHAWNTVDVQIDTDTCKAKKYCDDYPRQSIATKIAIALSKFFNRKVDEFYQFFL